MSERLSEERLSWIELGSKTTQLDIVALVAEVRELRQELAARAEDNLRLVGTLREVSAVMGIPDDEPIAKAAVRIMGELADSQAKREQAEAQVAVMDGRLRSLVDTADCEQCIAKSPIGCAGEACSITHIKRMVESVPYEELRQRAEQAEAELARAQIDSDDLANIEAECDQLRQQVAVYERELSRWQTRAEQSEFAATKNRKWAEICERQLADLLAEREKMRAALEWYADESHWQDGVAGWLKEEPEMAMWGPHWRYHFCRDNGQRAREALREGVMP